MAVIHTLPGTIKIEKQEYITGLKDMYQRSGFSEYASTIYAEVEAYDMFARIAYRKSMSVGRKRKRK